MLVNTQIVKWGNSLALRISGPMRTVPNFTQGMNIQVEVSEEGLKVYSLKKKQNLNLPFSQEELIKHLNPKNSHKKILANISDDEWDI